MNARDSFYCAAVQEPRTLLGLRLRPLSLGHIVLMNRVGSAFMTGDPPHYDDLAVSVFICAVDYRTAVAELDNPELPAAMGRWARKLTRTRFVDRLLRRRPLVIDLSAKVREFRDYLVAGSWHPEYIASGGEGGTIDLPGEQLIRVTLMRELGFGEAELMDRSWAMCLTDFYTLRALDGAVNIIDADEIQALIDKVSPVLQQHGNSP